VFQRQGSYDKALDIFNAILKVKGDNLAALHNKAVALMKLNHNAEALECLNQVIKAKPDPFNALFVKGNLLKDMNQYKEAIEVYDKAISINGNRAKVYNNKGMLIIHRDPHYMKATALYELKIWDEALAAY
jgi:tetratricopeptide (TPR) repeat protein